MGEWIKITVDSKNVLIEEVEPQEARIRFVCEPIDPNQKICELMAIVPRGLQEEVVNVWREIIDEEDETEVLSKLVALILQVDDNPYIRMEYDKYFLRIEINPPN